LRPASRRSSRHSVQNKGAVEFGTSEQIRRFRRIYTLVGEPEKALDQLEPLLKIPYYLSPGWLKIDPNFDSLRKNPRFQKLVAAGK
jgi:hypothetical protein